MRSASSCGDGGSLAGEMSNGRRPRLVVAAVSARWTRFRANSPRRRFQSLFLEVNEVTRVGSRFRTPAKAIALLTGHTLSLLCMALWAPNTHAYPMYDDGAGKGCVTCHNGFQGGNGPLHFQHR